MSLTRHLERLFEPELARAAAGPSPMTPFLRRPFERADPSEALGNKFRLLMGAAKTSSEMAGL